MALDFPSNPVDGQVFDSYYYNAAKAVWKSIYRPTVPNVLNAPTITDATITATATTSSTVPLTVNGAASQSANLQEWKNSTGTTISSIDSLGNLTNNSVTTTNLNLNRIDSSYEGGQVNFRRSTDNAEAWYIDVYGNTNSPSLRFLTPSQINVIFDPSGRVTKPYQPAFGVHSTQATTQGNDIVWEQTSFNVGSHYNTSNGRFTAPVSGYYYFHAHGLWNYSVTGDLRVSLYKNGSGFSGMRTIETKAVGQWITWHIQGIVSMAAGDYATVRVDQLTNGMHTDAGYNQFSGYLMG